MYIVTDKSRPFLAMIHNHTGHIAIFPDHVCVCVCHGGLKTKNLIWSSDAIFSPHNLSSQTPPPKNVFHPGG